MRAPRGLRCAISKIVGVVLLILITVSAGITLYAYVEGRVGGVSEYGVNVKPARIEAIKLYALRDFLKLFLYVSLDPYLIKYVYVRDPSTGHVYRAVPDIVQRISNDLYLVVVTIPKSFVRSRIIQVMMSAGGRTEASVPTSVDLRHVPVTPLPVVYLLAIQGYPSSWVSAQKLLTVLQPLVGKLISKVVVVSTPREWENLLNKGPASAIVINCHGEAVPATASMASNAGKPSKWVGLFRRIGERVRGGWIWVSVIGYPFYYVANASGLYSWSPTYGKYGPGSLGAKVVLGAATGGYGLFWGYNGVDLLASITDSGVVAANLTGVELPRKVYASRSLNLGAFPQVAVEPFYVNVTGGVTYYSAEAIYVGRGAFVLIGFSAFEDDASVNASIALSIYTYIFRKPPLPLSKASGTAYVLECLDTPGSWSETQVVDSRVVNVEGIASEVALRLMGLKVKNVSSANGVWGVLGAPEARAVVVNTLEEALPIPRELIQGPTTTTYWHPLTNEGVVISLYTYGLAPPAGFVNYTSRFTLENGSVTLYVVPLTLATVAGKDVALQINYGVNAVRFTESGVIAYVESGGTVVSYTLDVGTNLLHTYAVTFTYNSNFGTLTIQVKDTDTGASDSVTGEGTPSQLVVWLGLKPLSSNTEASALIKALEISGKYVLDSTAHSGSLAVSFTSNDAATIASRWSQYFTQSAGGSPPTTYPLWKTLISLIMLRIKQGWVVILNSNGYTAYYVSSPLLSGRYTIGAKGLSWIMKLMGGSVTVNWNELYPRLLNTLPGWSTPNWVASRMQLPNGLAVVGKSYGTSDGYLMCYAVRFGSGTLLLGGASTNGLPVNLMLLNKVIG